MALSSCSERRMLKERLTAFLCVICDSVRLEECQANDLGVPAHEACLADQLRDETRKRKATLERWQL
jgi:hypothetical protein